MEKKSLAGLCFLFLVLFVARKSLLLCHSSIIWNSTLILFLYWWILYKSNVSDICGWVYLNMQKKLWCRLRQRLARTWRILTGVHASPLAAAMITARTKNTWGVAGAGTISGVGALETVNRILPNPNKRACRAFYK